MVFSWDERSEDERSESDIVSALLAHAENKKRQFGNKNVTK